MSEPNDSVMFSIRMPLYMREELSRTADKMIMNDSNFVRIAITSALTKYANRTSPQPAVW